MPLPLFSPGTSSPNSSPMAFGSHIKRGSLKNKAINALQDFNIYHFAFKTVAYSWLAFIVWMAWKISPFSGAWTLPQRTESVPIRWSNIASYFNPFAGGIDCGLNAIDLYIPPKTDSKGPLPRTIFCPSRGKLLDAMSGGGRIGFDAAYVPQGCHYRWYDVAEVCMILERFDKVVFVGDDTLQSIYAGFNILLRQDVALGAMKQWEMADEELKTCKCDGQFAKESCAKYLVSASEQVSTNARNVTQTSAGYMCHRTAHAFLKVDFTPVSKSTISAFNQLVPKAPPSVYKPIPIIYSLTSSHSTSAATKNLDDLILYADATKRKTPMLWVGPPASPHLEGKEGAAQQDVWRFSKEMAQASKDRDVESLGLWNMTVQANSNGKNFGEGVAITQAMMIINWLSRLETS